MSVWQEKNASKMLVALRRSKYFGLPWSALIYYSLPWSASATAGLAAGSLAAAADLAAAGLATAGLVPLHPSYTTLHPLATPCTPIMVMVMVMVMAMLLFPIYVCMYG